MFQRFLNTVRRFMAGRYGTDSLNRFLFFAYLAVWLVSQFFHRHQIVSLVLLGALWAILGWLLFRTLSRNIPARQRENDRFLRWWAPCQRGLSRLWDRLRDIRRYRYRRCPACSARLRLPLPIKKGRRTVTCHRCRTQFKSFFIL